MNSIRQASLRRFPTQPVRLDGCVISDIGLARPSNEDNYVLDGHINAGPDGVPRCITELTSGPGWHIAGVFDGMGGGEKGALAAHIAAETFGQSYLKMPPIHKEDADLLIRQCFRYANNQIIDLKREYRIHGTTGTVLCTNGAEFKIYHLGDSRAYLFRDGELFQLTKDQTLAQMKIDTGIYDPHIPRAEAEHHILTEFIGRDQTRERIRPVESQWISLLPGDRLLLCSDGLYHMCDDRQIAGILSNCDSAADAAEKLTAAAICCGGADNITCLVISQQEVVRCTTIPPEALTSL